MRAVMAKLKKKRGGDIGRPARRRTSRPGSAMSKDEAAVAIQKSEF